MELLTTLLAGHSSAGQLLALSVVAAVGIALGHLRILGVSIGVAGVLFAGLGWSIAFWGTPDHDRKHVLEFLREFGLVLFVYGLGMQVGPAFAESLRRDGLRWCAIALASVLLSFATCFLVASWAQIPVEAAIGILCGATTNTPSLAAAEATLRDHGYGASGQAPVGYAVAYPLGVIGIIAAILTVRALFRIDPRAEGSALLESMAGADSKVGSQGLKVVNPGLVGRRIGELDSLAGGAVVVSRLSRGGVQRVAHDDDTLAQDDEFLAIAKPEVISRLIALAGATIDRDLRKDVAPIVIREAIVTAGRAVGATVGSLDLHRRFAATATRIRRGSKELVADDQLELRFADRLVLVGSAEAVEQATAALGDSQDDLRKPQLASLFCGIAIGVGLGSIPFWIPGLSAPVKLGLAGGPLVAALVLSRLGRIGHLNFFIANSANRMLREVGICLFLACVGLMAGPGFLHHALSGEGLTWIAVGAAITIIPLLLIGILGRLLLRMNFAALSGVMAGSYTDPPALAVANTVAGSEAPVLSYAAVYPLVMLSRVIGIQVLILIWLPPLPVTP